MKKNYFQKGFTLIELLVVIMIIGVLSAIALPNFMGARERARDAKRKSDVKQIQKALELYKDDQSPPAYPADLSTDCDSTWQSATNTVYMSKFPCDPLNSATQTCRYTYARDAGDSLKYTLSACLENKSDPQGLGACNICGGTQTGLLYQVTEP